MSTSVQSALKDIFHLNEFRGPQREIVEALLSGQDILAVLPTGAGKSLCYQLPAVLFPRLTIVISPLIALMKDQVHSLLQKNIPAALWNSEATQSTEKKLKQNITEGSLKILYLSPEKLLRSEVLQFLAEQNPSQVTIDEAHCIVQWGGEFRPEYARIRDFLLSIPKKPVVSAFTATAPPESVAHIQRSLGLQAAKLVSLPYVRPNLRYGVLRPTSEANKRMILLHLLQYWKTSLWGSALVYATTRSETEAIALWLQQNGFPKAFAFHAGLSPAKKSRRLRQFSREARPLVVATSAFGMGIDRSDVRLVLHHSPPVSLEAYAQESGRAGRDSLESWCLLLYRQLDLERNFLMVVENSTFAHRREHRRRALQVRGYAENRGCLARALFRHFRLKRTETWNFTQCGCLSCAPHPDWKQQKAKDKKFSHALFSTLRTLRQKRAKELGVPPYFLGNDALLQKLCAQRPQSWSELKTLAGFGHVRLYYWGRDVLSTLNAEAKPLVLPAHPP